MATGRIPINGTAAIQETIVDAKGDLIVGTGADAVARLAVGTNGHTLVADSSVSPTGLKWAAPAAGGMTELASGSLSGTTVTLSSISGSYKNLQFVVRDFIGGNTNGSFYAQLRVNGDTGTAYTGSVLQSVGATPSTFNTTSFTLNADDIARNTDRNASIVIDFYDYANTSANKNILALLSGYKDTNFYSSFSHGAYRPATAAAITSISLICSDAAGWTQGTYVLYGVS